MLAFSAKPALVAAWSIVTGLTLAAPAPLQTGPVTLAEWSTLLKRAENGGTVELGDRAVQAGGGPFTPSARVTIRGGVFQQLNINGWRDVTFDGARFVGPPGTPTFHNLVLAIEVENITFRNCSFEGYQTPDGELHVRGPSIREARNVVIERSTFTRMAGFTHFFRTVGARFRDNDLKTMREGLDVMGGRDIIVERNRFEDFQPYDGDHADGVQFFTTGLNRPDDLATREAVVRDNLFLSRGRAQAVFTNDEIGIAASGRGFADFTIENNLIVGAAYHGVTATNIDRVTVRGNRLLRVRGQDPYEGRITIYGGPAVVEGNQVNAILPSDRTTARGNRLVRDTDPSDTDAAIAEWMARFRKR